MNNLEAGGIAVQSFYSQSHFVPADGAMPITGRCYRHLDSWLMNADVCRDVFVHGACGADLSIVDGDYDNGNNHGGASLDALCHALELPRLAVVDPVAHDSCLLPPRPEQVDGVLLLNIADRGELARQQCRFEALWGVRVLGGLVACPHLSAILERLPPGARPSRELCRALGEALVLRDEVDTLLDLAAPASWARAKPGLFQPIPRMAGLNVAVAYDDAFGNYFPDTLDLLELSGANLRDFSPLSDDGLPNNTDIVYLGCGQVERYASALADNACMIASLRRYAQAGGRVYGEGGAIAYLSHQVELESGMRSPMAGLLPAIARYNHQAGRPTPAEMTVARDCWFAKAGDSLRGYHNSRWRIEPLAPIGSLVREPAQRFDLLRAGNVIASNIHLNLVGQPNLLASFLALAAAPTR